VVLLPLLPLLVDIGPGLAESAVAFMLKYAMMITIPWIAQITKSGARESRVLPFNGLKQ